MDYRKKKTVHHLFTFLWNDLVHINRICCILFFSFIAISISVTAYSAPNNNPWGFDTIQVAAESDYNPFSYVDKSGAPSGLSVELFNAACEAVGITAQIKTGIWDHIRNDLKIGEIDALPFVGRNDEREKYFDFTMPYITLHGAVFLRKKDIDSYHSLEDLRDKSIVVMKGDNAEEFIRNQHLTTRITTTPTFKEAFILLSEGNYDALIMQRVTGLMLLKELRIKNIGAHEMPVPGFEQSFCFAVKEGNHRLLEALNEGLSIVIANQTFSEIRKKWMGPSLDGRIQQREILSMVAKILIPILSLLFIIWIIILRIIVKNRTEKLHLEIESHKETGADLQKSKQALEYNANQLNLLLDSAAEGIFGLDKHGNCTFLNRSAKNMLKIPDDDSVIGKDLHHIIDHKADDGKETEHKHCKIKSTFTTGKKTHSNSETFTRLDGKTLPVEYFSYPITTKNEIIGSVTTFLDITERIEAEKVIRQFNTNLKQKVDEQTLELKEKVEKLDKSQQAMLYMVEDLNEMTNELKAERKKLEQTNTELEAFTYSVSHDLKAPLRAINGFTRFLKEDFSAILNDEGNRFLDTIIENATKMNQLITDLLNLSRISRSAFNYEEVDMMATADSMYREIVPISKRDLFELELNDIPRVQADAGLIKQVWQNLIENAVKYSRKSSDKKIIIDGYKEDDNNIYIIRDYGAGFNEKYMHKLFGAFQRLHRDDEFEGTGIGLALVNRIITRHGGNIWAESPDDQGATFYFSLPVRVIVKKKEMSDVRS